MNSSNAWARLARLDLQDVEHLLARRSRTRSWKRRSTAVRRAHPVVASRPGQRGPDRPRPPRPRGVQRGTVASWDGRGLLHRDRSRSVDLVTRSASSVRRAAGTGASRWRTGRWRGGGRQGRVGRRWPLCPGGPEEVEHERRGAGWRARARGARGCGGQDAGEDRLPSSRDADRRRLAAVAEMLNLTSRSRSPSARDTPGRTVDLRGSRGLNAFDDHHLSPLVEPFTGEVFAGWSHGR